MEVHDPFHSSSQWLQSGFLCGAIILVLVMVSLGVITNGRRHPLGKGQAAQTRKIRDIETPFPVPFAQQQLTEKIEFPTFWEPTLEGLALAVPSELLEESVEQPTTPVLEVAGVGKMIAKTVEVAKEDLELKTEKGEKAKEGLEEEAKEFEKVNKEQDHEEKMNEAKKEKDDEKAKMTKDEKDMTDDMNEDKDEIRDERGKQNESHTEERDETEDLEEASKVDVKEGGSSESSNNVGTDGFDKSPANGEEVKKKKKHRVRQNAKKRAAKRAAAEEASKEAGGTANSLPGKSKEVESEAVRPEVSEAPAVTKDQEED